MKLNYTFKHIDTSESLAAYAADKLDEISRFLLKAGHGSVYFSKLKSEFLVEISLNTAHRYFKASATGEDAYGTVDAVVEKLQKQVLKINKQIKNHKKPELTKEHRAETVMRWKKAA